MRTHIAVCAWLILGLALPALAGSTRDDDVSRIQNASDIFQDIVNTPDSSIPLDIIQSAQCIAIIPSELHFAFFFGGQYGKGLVTCRVGRRWSAPAFVMISGGSFGLQFGGSSTDLILIFRNRDGLNKLLSDKFKIGGEATAAAGSRRAARGRIDRSGTPRRDTYLFPKPRSLCRDQPRRISVRTGSGRRKGHVWRRREATGNFERESDCATSSSKPA
jgi:lipid-binding SYLF domain-containing protein